MSDTVAAPVSRPWWRTHWPMALVMALALPLYLVGAHTVRLDYGPDETAHLEYIHWLAREGRLPTPQETWAVQHPPGYYLLMAAVYRASGNTLAPMRLPMGKERLAQMAPSEQRARLWCRHTQVLLGMIVLALLAALGRELLPGRPRVQALALAAFAVWPMVIYMNSVVNSDLLAEALCCALALTAFRLRRTPEGDPWRQGALLGLLMALALWTKITTVYIVPLVVLVAWGGGRDWSRRRRLLGAFTGVALVLGSGWYVRHLLTVGTPFPNFVGGTGQEEQLRTVLRYDFFGQGLGLVLGSSWTLLQSALVPEFIWGPVGFLRPATVQVLLRLLIAVPVLALLLTAARGRERSPMALPGRDWALGLGGIALCLLMVLYFAFSSDFRAISIGRYLLGAAPWFYLGLLGTGERVAGLVRSSAGRAAGTVVVLTALGAAAVWFMVRLVAWYASIGVTI